MCVVAKPKNRKTAGTDGVMNEFVKYGEGTVTMLVTATQLDIKQNHALKRWREGVVYNIFKKGIGLTGKN